jgi:hypothetical protein
VSKKAAFRNRSGSLLLPALVSGVARARALAVVRGRIARRLRVDPVAHAVVSLRPSVAVAVAVPVAAPRRPVAVAFRRVAVVAVVASRGRLSPLAPLAVRRRRLRSAGSVPLTLGRRRRRPAPSVAIAVRRRRRRPAGATVAVAVARRTRMAAALALAAPLLTVLAGRIRTLASVVAVARRIRTTGRFVLVVAPLVGLPWSPVFVAAVLRRRRSGPQAQGQRQRARDLSDAHGLLHINPSGITDGRSRYCTRS